MMKITKNQLKREYLIDKLTSCEIAKKYNYSTVWINLLRKKYKINSIKRYKRYPKQRLSSKQKQLIYGTLLGDGSLKFGTKKCKNSYLSISHSNKELTKFKYNIIKDFVKKGIKEYNYKKKKRNRMHYFNTFSHPIFTNIFKQTYPGKIKTISKIWLNKLTPFGLAIWYMDDGSIAQSNHQMRISTESFSYKEHLLIKKHFKNKWDIKVNINKSSRPGKFILLFKAKERDKFFKLITPFIIPKMDYKICKNLRKWEKWSSFELNYLKKNYKAHKTNWKDFSKVLNHSKQAVYRKASYLGLCRGEVT